MNNYEIWIEIPSLYVQKSTFWEPDPTYAIKTQYYSVPKNDDKDVFEFELNQKRNEYKW